MSFCFISAVWKPFRQKSLINSSDAYFPSRAGAGHPHREAETWDGRTCSWVRDLGCGVRRLPAGIEFGLEIWLRDVLLDQDCELLQVPATHRSIRNSAADAHISAKRCVSMHFWWFVRVPASSSPGFSSHRPPGAPCSSVIVYTLFSFCPPHMFILSVLALLLALMPFRQWSEHCPVLPDLSVLVFLAFFFFATPCGVCNLSSLTRDQTCVPYIGTTGEVPSLSLSECFFCHCSLSFETTVLAILFPYTHTSDGSPLPTERQKRVSDRNPGLFILSPLPFTLLSNHTGLPALMPSSGFLAEVSVFLPLKWPS